MDPTALVLVLLLVTVVYGAVRGRAPAIPYTPEEESERSRRLAEIERRPLDPVAYIHLHDLYRTHRDRASACELSELAREHLKDHSVVRDLTELALFGERYGRGQPRSIPPPVEVSRQRMRFDLDHDRFEMEVSDFWFQDFLEIDRAKIHLENYSTPRVPGGPDPRRYRVMHAGGRIVEERLNAFLNHPRFQAGLPISFALSIDLSVGEMVIKGRVGPAPFQIPLGIRVQNHYLVVISLHGPPWVLGAIPIPAAMIFDQVAARAVKAGRGMIRRLDGLSLGLDIRPLFPFEPELNLVDLSLRPGEITFTCDAATAEAEKSRPPPPQRPPPARLALPGTPRLNSPEREELRRAVVVGDRQGATAHLESILEKGDLLGPDPELGRLALSYERADLAMSLALPNGMVAGAESYLIGAEAALALQDHEKAKHLLHEAVDRAVTIEEGSRAEFLLSAARLAATTEVLREATLREILDPARWPAGTRTDLMREAIRIATEKDPGGLGRALSRLWCERQPFLAEAHQARARCHELSGDSLTSWIAFSIAQVLDPSSDLAQRGRARNSPRPLAPAEGDVREVRRLAMDLDVPPAGPDWLSALPALSPHLDWIWTEPEDPTLIQRTASATPSLAAKCRLAADLLGAPDLSVRVGLPRWPTGTALAAGSRHLVLDERRLVRLDPDELDFYVGHEISHVALGHARFLSMPEERFPFFRAAMRHLPAAHRRSKSSWKRSLLGGALSGEGVLGPRLLGWLGESARFSALWFSVPDHVMEKIPDTAFAAVPDVPSRAALHAWLCDLADRGGLLVAGDPRTALSSMIKGEVDAWSLREEILSRGLEWAHGRLAASTRRRIRKLILTLSTDAFRDRLNRRLNPADEIPGPGA